MGYQAEYMLNYVAFHHLNNPASYLEVGGYVEQPGFSRLHEGIVLKTRKEEFRNSWFQTEIAS